MQWMRAATAAAIVAACAGVVQHSASAMASREMTALPANTVVGDSTLLPLGQGALDTLVRKHAGDVVLVDFWATWCAPCRAELPALVKLHDELQKEGFRLVTVSADDPEQAREAIAFLDSVRAPSSRYIKHAV